MNERNEKKKRKAWLLLPAGCLGILLTPFILSWFALRAYRPDPPAPVQGTLDWEEEIGSHPPAGGDPRPATLPSAAESLTLPQVLSVQDAVEADSTWILLDARLGRLHFLHPTSGLLGSVGNKGPGPGEFQDPLAVAVSGPDLWVLNQRGLLLDRFTLDGTFVDRRRIRGGGCLAGLAKGLADRGEKGLLLLRVCPATLPGPGSAWLENLDPGGELTPVLSLPLGNRGSRRLHLLRQPAMAADEKRVFLGTWDAPCLMEVSSDGIRSGPRCLPDFDRAAAAAADRANLERRFGRLPALGFLPMEIPDRLPWYDRLFVIPGGVAVLRIQGEEDRDLVFLPDTGAPEVIETRFPRNTYLGNRTILTVEDLLQGSRIRVYPNPWS